MMILVLIKFQMKQILLFSLIIYREIDRSELAQLKFLKYAFFILLAIQYHDLENLLSSSLCFQYYLYSNFRSLYLKVEFSFPSLHDERLFFMLNVQYSRHFLEKELYQ